jgi:hypothetical protein
MILFVNNISTYSLKKKKKKKKKEKKKAYIDLTVTGFFAFF